MSFRPAPEPATDAAARAPGGGGSPARPLTAHSPGPPQGCDRCFSELARRRRCPPSARSLRDGTGSQWPGMWGCGSAANSSPEISTHRNPACQAYRYGQAPTSPPGPEWNASRVGRRPSARSRARGLLLNSMSSRTCRILGIRGWYHYATMAPPGKPGFSHRRDVRSDHVAEAWQGYVNAVLYMTQVRTLSRRTLPLAVAIGVLGRDRQGMRQSARLPVHRRASGKTAALMIQLTEDLVDKHEFPPATQLRARADWCDLRGSGVS